MPQRLRAKIYKKRYFALLTFLISSLIVWGGISYYKYNEKIIRADRENELRAIGNLKSEQITEWVRERGSDVKYYSQSKDLLADFKEFLKNKNDEKAKKKIAEKLRLTKESHSYLDILLLTTKGEITFTFIGEKKLNNILLPYLKHCIDEKRIVYTDLSLCEQHNEIHYDILSPLIDEKGNVFAALLTRLNAKDFLFPLVQKWPTPSKTAETILLRKEGEHALYLNNLRHRDSTALKFKTKLTDTHLPGVQAVMGFEGIFDGIDYRSVEVFADVRKIPNTNWFMVTKVDKAEMFSELKTISFFTIIFIITLILFSALGLSLLYNFRQKNIYRQLFNTERKYFDAKDEFRTALYSIGDAVITTDLEGNVRNLNHVAEELTGWKETEAFGKPLSKVFKIINEETRNEVENPVTKVLEHGLVVGLANHTVLISKNGKETPIADSGAPIKNENGDITGVVLVFRDQTEERANRKAIEESEKKFRKLFETTNEGIALHELVCNKDDEPVDYRFLDVNKRFEEILSLRKENIIGKNATEVYKLDTPPFLRLYSSTALNGTVETFDTYFEPMKKHFSVTVYSPERGKFATVFQDITEKRLAKEKIEQQYSTLNGINESVKSAIFSIDREYRYTSFNSVHKQIMKAIYGVDIELGKIMPDYITVKEESDMAKNNFDKVFNGKSFTIESYSGETRLNRLYFEISHNPILNNEGKVVGAAVFARDLTEHKQMENKLQESENRFLTVYNESPVAIVITTVAEGMFKDVNNAFLKQFGYEREEIIGKTVRELNFYNNIRDRDKLLLKLLDKEPIRAIEMKIVNKNGEIRDCLISMNMITIDGHPHLITSVDDITNLKKIDSALQESEARLNAFMEFIPALILIKDEQLRSIYANDNFKKLFPFDEWYMKKPHEVFSKEVADYMIEQDTFALEKGFIEYEEDWTDLSGNTNTYYTQKFRIQIAGKSPLIGAIISDISKRKQAEAALTQSETKYKYLFKNNPQPMWVYDTETLKYLEVNNVAVQKYGYTREEFLSMTLKEIRPEEDVPKLIEDVKNTNNIYNNAGEWRHKKKNGEIIDVEIISHKIDFDGIDARLVIAHDITERKKAEKELSISENRFSTAFNSNASAMAITRLKDGTIVNVNSSYEKLLGYTYGEIVGKKVSDLNIYKAGYSREMLVQELNEKGIINERVTNFKTKYNEIITVMLSIEKMDLNNDVYLLSTFYDITERQRAEQIKEIQFKIANSVVTSIDLYNLLEIVRKELNKIIDTSNFFVALYNEETDMLNVPFEKGFEDGIKIWKAEKSLTGLVVKEKKLLHLNKDDIQKLADEGTISLIGERSESWLGVPLKLGNKVLGAIVLQNYDRKNAFDKSSVEILEIVAHELSIYIDRKKAEEVANRLSKGIENSPVCIIVTDIDGNIEYVNPKFTELSGYSLEEVHGKNPRILKSGEQNKDFYKTMWETIKSGNDWKGELHNKKKNGELYWESAIISPIFGGNNQITHFIGIKEDITEKKEMINDLIKAKENAEEMNRLKSSFLANMSHELRTPLNGILGFAEIMTNEAQNEDSKMMAQIIFKSGKRLHNTLNQILNLSTLQADVMKARKDIFDINVIIEESYNLFKADAKIKNIDLRLDIPESPVILQTDKVILLNTINNIVENALKYTIEGYVKISLFEKESNIIIEVEDTGIGIEEANQEIIFDEFRQASEGYSRSFEGTGLGLSICRKYMKLLGGNIKVKSTHLQGSTFTIELPKQELKDISPAELNDDTKAIIRQDSDKILSEKFSEKILYIENDIDNQELVKMILNDYAEVDIANDAADGIKMAKESDYSIILMDINLGSGMNGKEVTKILRKSTRYKDVPIVAVTAFAMDGDKEEFIESGCTHYISKPFEIDKMQKLIFKLLNERNTEK